MHNGCQSKRKKVLIARNKCIRKIVTGRRKPTQNACQAVSDGHLNSTLVLHKIPAQNRFATSIAASKGLYSFFLDLT
jgi:hypothetical protein